jgi:hypothetical protein
MNLLILIVLMQWVDSAQVLVVLQVLYEAFQNCNWMNWEDGNLIMLV